MKFLQVDKLTWIVPEKVTAIFEGIEDNECVISLDGNRTINVDISATKIMKLIERSINGD